MTTNKSKSVDATRVSFRLQPETAAILAEQAVKAGTSHNLHARELLTAALLKGDERDHDGDMIHAELARIRSALSAANERREEVDSVLVELREIWDNLTAAAAEASEHEARQTRFNEVLANIVAADAKRQVLLESLCTQFTLATKAVSAMDKEQHIKNILSEIASVRAEVQQIRKLRGDLATSVSILLPHAGKLTAEQSKAWVQKTLLTP